MRPAPRVVAIGLGLALASPAQASIPGNIEQRAREGLLHVCEDVEPSAGSEYIPCSEQTGDATTPYTGSECVPAGLPAACVIDFLPKPRLKGRLLLILDDTAQDNAGGSRIQASLVLELWAGWRKATLIEIFDGSKIGNWNTFDEAFLTSQLPIQFTNGALTAFQFSNQNLEELGLEVRAIAQSWFPQADLAGAVPVLTSIAADPKRKPVDHGVLSDPLASAATYKIVIEFARVRP